MLPRTIELRIGPPRWYPYAIAAVCAAVCLALCLARPEWPFTLLVLALAACIATRARWHAVTTSKARSIRVFRNGAVTLLDHHGTEHSVQVHTVHWATPGLVALAILPAKGRAMNLVLSRDRNSRQAFRRFVVLCRFGFAADEPGVQNTQM